MSGQIDPGNSLPDPAEVSQAMTEIAEKSQRLISQFIERHSNDEHQPNAERTKDAQYYY